MTPSTPTSAASNSWGILFGIPELLVCDNGLDLTSFAVADACHTAGIDLMFTPVRSPWFKGVVERFGGTVNTRVIHRMPGTTLGRPTSREDYDGAEHATLTDLQFHYLLDRYLSTVHNRTPGRVRGLAPAKLFRQGILQWPARLPASEEEFDAQVALTKYRILTKDGIFFLGLQYQNEELQRLWNRVPARTHLTLKINPVNLQTIRVLHPVTSEAIAVSCTAELAWPLSLSLHIAVRGHARRINLNPDDMKQLVQAEESFMQKMNEFEAKNKASLRRMQAKFLQEAQERDSTESDDVASRTSFDSVGTEALDSVLAQLGDES